MCLRLGWWRDTCLQGSKGKVPSLLVWFFLPSLACKIMQNPFHILGQTQGEVSFGFVLRLEWIYLCDCIWSTAQVQDSCLPWVHALRTIRTLRTLLMSRGGWKQLERDMETGTQVWKLPAAWDQTISTISNHPMNAMFQWTFVSSSSFIFLPVVKLWKLSLPFLSISSKLESGFAKHPHKTNDSTKNW